MEKNNPSEEKEILSVISTPSNVCIRIEKINSNILRIFIDYRSQSIICLYFGICLLTTVGIYDIVVFFNGLIDLMYDSIVFFLFFSVLWPISLIYLRSKIEEFIFDKKDNNFSKMKSFFGIKNTTRYNLTDVQQVKVEKEKNPWNANNFKVKVILQDGTEFLICGWPNKEQAIELSYRMSNFLNKQIVYS